MTEVKNAIEIKVPVYSATSFPKPPWGARIERPLFGGAGVERNFRAGAWQGTPEEGGILSIRAEAGDFVQHGHTCTDPERTIKSGIHEVVAYESGKLRLGEEVDAKTAAQTLRERHQAALEAGNVPENDRKRAAGAAAWLMEQNGVSVDEVSAALERRAQRAAKASTDTGQEQEDEGPTPG